MNRADGMAEAVAAGLVSIDILRDGEQPKRPTNSKEHDLLPFRIARHFESFDRVEEAGVRMREEDHVFFGETSPCQRMKMISSQKLQSSGGAQPNLVGACMI
jgi:hypothetical protein